jgi:diguanylate cyclase (GGDEF)-like protein
VNSPFGNNRAQNANNSKGGRDGKFSETVIMDNKFHQQLSNVRNRDVDQNHPDIELMKREAQQQSNRHLATLYRLPALKDPGVPAAQVRDQETTIAVRTQSQVVSFHECMKRLECETKRARKFERPFSLAIVGFGDIINVPNTFGVQAYQQALGQIDAVLCNVVDTDIDTVGRYSNDRFMVLLPECTGPSSTMFAETTRQYFETVPIKFENHSFFLRASIGIACFPNHGHEWKEILARADLACESVLSKGGNAFAFASMM